MLHDTLKCSHCFKGRSNKAIKTPGFSLVGGRFLGDQAHCTLQTTQGQVFSLNLRYLCVNQATLHRRPLKLQWLLDVHIPIELLSVLFAK